MTPMHARALAAEAALAALNDEVNEHVSQTSRESHGCDAEAVASAAETTVGAGRTLTPVPCPPVAGPIPPVVGLTSEEAS